MWLAIDAVKKGDADVAVSAGNTGALMAMSRFHLRTLPGVKNPAIAALWPLFENSTSDDVILVQINPIRRPGAPDEPVYGVAVKTTALNASGQSVAAETRSQTAQTALVSWSLQNAASCSSLASRRSSGGAAREAPGQTSSPSGRCGPTSAAPR